MQRSDEAASGLVQNGVADAGERHVHVGRRGRRYELRFPARVMRCDREWAAAKRGWVSESVKAYKGVAGASA
jgi:hypothetical protein